ncbi:MAG: chromosome segregation protein SMC [Gudongella sp.]|nr:chromosome segregation protein SMC [Gudongella sp.]
MYLKKVDIQGFKSFADKTEVAFNNRITAIVGPNGSGKSNIADAIRWVLGEQSVKSLRGNKMEDVIFSGTEKRKALGYSEVSITFDNAEGKIPLEYREVVVTRRMFRSGESEYYINKNSCRLKDIRELFMDTGIGKEGYSIIGQGKIDEILSNKPEDRRNIFEEAAGIVKYKTKKQEALRKLERTRTNLIRIGDLLQEIKTQKDNLKIEADKAIEFQHLFNKLREIDVNLLVLDIDKMNNKLETINEKQLVLDQERDIIEKDNAVSDDHYLDLKSNLSILEKEIEEKRTLKLENVQSYEKSNTALKIVEEKAIYLNKEINRLKEDLGKNNLLLSNDDNNNDTAKKLDLLIEQRKESLSNQNKKLNNRDLLIRDLELQSTKTHELKNQMMLLYNKISDKRSELNTITLFSGNITKKNNQIDLELKDVYKKNIEIENNIIVTKKDLNANASLLTNKNLEIIKITKDIDKINKEILSLRKILTEKENELINSTNSIKLYKTMESQYEGYFQSVKDIVKVASKDSNQYKGFIGVVAELFEVNKLHLKAIEIALGSSIQNIVVEDDLTAKRFIEHLKVSKKGRATFLPLNTVRGNNISISENMKTSYNLLGTADELIEYNPRYQNIFKNLLGRTVVAKDIDSAILYSKKTDFKTRIVTLDGDVINPGGSLTGGSFKNNSISILNRKDIIKDLSLKIQNINDSIKKYNIELEHNITNLNTVNDKLNILKLEEEKVKTKIMDLESTLRNSNIDLKRATNDIQRIELEQKQLKTESEDLIDKESKLKTENDKMNLQLQEYQLEIKKSEEILEDLKTKKEKFDDEITELKIMINQMDSEINEKNRLILQNKKDLDDIRNTIELKSSELIEAKKMLELNIQEKNEIKSGLEKFSLNESMQSNTLNELIVIKDKKMNEFYEYGEKLKVYNRRLTQLERDINKLEIEKTRSNMQIETLTEKLENDYDLNYESALQYTFEVKDMKEAKTSVMDLKDKIRSLGNVNISYIEEYKAVNERHDFLSKQLTDLSIAKDDIEIVIKDIDKKMRISFKQAFDQINIRFGETFSALFNGGKARLEMYDGDDILTAGIEIMAQPPGKKLQSLTLLSGGEKSLTAVALLFAILKIKPAPFCILDEIDAALDEANITRYTDYLQKLDNKTQFVLITHRKTTMEIADVLYGVTMEEDGISKLLSLKLKDFNEVAS